MNKARTLFFFAIAMLSCLAAAVAVSRSGAGFPEGSRVLLISLFLAGFLLQRLLVTENIIQEQRLIEIGRVTSTFIHDITNPLAVIKNTRFFLTRRSGRYFREKEWKEEDLRKEFQSVLEEGLSDIQAAGRQQELLIQEVRDIIRGRVVLKSSRMELKEFFAGMPQAFRKHVAEIRLELRYPGPVELDAGRFERVFSHLVKNAGEATAGQAVVTISAEKKDHGVRFVVTDNRPEMPRGRWLFSFAARTVAPKQELSVVSEIVKAHGGKIRVESAKGPGRRVIIDIPQHKGEDENKA